MLELKIIMKNKCATSKMKTTSVYSVELHITINPRPNSRAQLLVNNELNSKYKQLA